VDGTKDASKANMLPGPHEARLTLDGGLPGSARWLTEEEVPENGGYLGATRLTGFFLPHILQTSRRGRCFESTEELRGATPYMARSVRTSYGGAVVPERDLMRHEPE
jgi:hypothetical protein